MSKNYKILKVKDSTDNNHIEHFPFSLPAKILINGKSQLSGKSTVILINYFYQNISILLVIMN